MTNALRGNAYQKSLKANFYKQTPKAVFAALAVSALTSGGDRLAEADALVLHEWWLLWENGIVSQKPPFQKPELQETPNEYRL